MFSQNKKKYSRVAQANKLRKVALFPKVRISLSGGIRFCYKEKPTYFAFLSAKDLSVSHLIDMQIFISNTFIIEKCQIE